MKILKFNQKENRLRVLVDTLEDLWTLQRIIFANDIVKSKSERRFRGHEGDIGELKEVMISLSIERTELDKNASRLRAMGKITDGRPIEYVKLNSYHTLNIAPGDTIDITKIKWNDYIIGVVKNAVSDTKRPRLGFIVMDDEKALPAYLLGYGVEFGKEVYSGLSKRMSQKDFAEQKKKYYTEIISRISEMKVDTIMIAGPGFEKDDLKEYINKEGIAKTIPKKIIFGSTSNPERSGVYELIKSDSVAELLRRERIREEFALMEQFLKALGKGSKYGIEDVEVAIVSYEAKIVIVNDNMLSDDNVKRVLEKAEENAIAIEVFNSDDDVGVQLSGFKNIACLV